MIGDDLEPPTLEPPRRPYIVCANAQFDVGPAGIVVGRSGDCDVRITDQQAYVSRHHLKLERDGHWVWVTDLDSTGGTWLHNQPVGPVARRHWLTDGDRVRFAGYELSVHLQSGPQLDPHLTTLAEAVMAAGPELELDTIRAYYNERRGTAHPKTVSNRLGDLATALGIGKDDECRGRGRSRMLLETLYYRLGHAGRPTV